MMHIVITGPESSGKTTLSKQLSERLGGTWVEEFSRTYVANIDRPYTLDDIAAIAEGQKANINATESEIIVSDTAFLVLKIWAHVRFGSVPESVKRYLQSVPVDLYVLCHPEIPWEYDPLRENPNDRERLFNLYKADLEEMQVPFIVVRGTEQERLEKVLQYLR